MVRLEQLSLIMALILAVGGCSDSASTAGWDTPDDSTVPSNEIRTLEGSSAFVSATDVFDAIQNNRDWVVIDVRIVEEYAAGHIPNSHRLWRNDIESSAFPYGGMALEKDALAALLSSLGASSESTFVVYDAIGGCDAARLWWLIRLYGHDKVALLDGGWQAWVKLNHPAVQAETPKRPTEFKFTGSIDSSLIINREELIAYRGQPNVVILDTRTLEEFDGSILRNGAFAAGHIPGSVHFDWGRSVDLEGDYLLHSANDIMKDLAEIGVTPEKTIITYCHSGVRSAHTTLILRELLGFEHVRNYDGSWIEWSYTLQTADDVSESEL